MVLTYDDIGSDDVQEFGSTIRRARKDHLCVCGTTIRAGQRYERKVAKVCGEIVVLNEGLEHIHTHEQYEAAYEAHCEREMDARRNGDDDW